MAVTSDMIVGFPGERVEDFEDTLEAMGRARFDRLYSFRFSPMSATRAALMQDTVPEAEKLRRLHALLALQKKISLEKNTQMEGQIVEVLVEGISPRDPDRYIGRTIYHQIVAFPASPAMVGRVVKVRIGRTTALTLLGEEIVEVLS